MSDLSFKVARRRKEAVTFDLEGDAYQYSFTPPKQAEMVLPMLDAESDLEAGKAYFEWLDKGLSEDDRARIYKRLKDPEDDLDTDVLQDVVEGLVAHVGARPTT